MERWSAIEADDVHLATIRVYANDVNPHTKKPRIILFLPPGPSSDGSVPHDTAEHMSSEPNTYELEMVNDSVENQIVVAERPKDPSLSASATSAALTTNTRARTTILTGRIKHECNLRPMFSASYRKQMRERHLKYNTPTRQIRMIEDAGVPGGRGGVNRLSSGVGVGAGGAFGDLIVRIRSLLVGRILLTRRSLKKTKPKPAKGTFERMARMPRNQLLDQIFTLFRDPARWGIKALREKTQQPEAYLKEVLSEVAFLHRSGEYNGLWELKDNFKCDSDRMIESQSLSDVKMEGIEEDDEDEDEDEEDEDMEEVS